jgi:hypothetical protein
MTAPGNGILLTVLTIVFTSCTGYAAGRIHQWYRTSLERDQAYRDGYDTATRSLFSVAARMVRPRRGEKNAARGTATVTSILAAPGAVSADLADPRADAAGAAAGGRHTVADELVHASTYRLTPDRIARATVPQQQVPQQHPVGERTMRVVASEPVAS